MKFTIPSVVKKFSAIFWEAGYELYLVGGAVRNLVLGRWPKDFDFASSAKPEEVKALFKRVIPTGIEHGTVTVLFMKQAFEVTTYRLDGTYSDNRRPDSVIFSESLTEDLERRDFTINAMAVHPLTGQVYDPFDGREDLHAKRIRTVGLPQKRFSEDALRIMRALRFSAQLDFDIDASALDKMMALADTVSHVSVERFRDEFLKIIDARKPARAIRLGLKTQIFQSWLPELEKLNFSLSDFNLLDHSIATLEALPENAAMHLKLAAFLHDIGKALCEDPPRFIKHEVYGAELVDTLLRRLRLPNKLREQSVHLVKQHMFDHRIFDKPAAVRRMLVRVGKDAIYDLLMLRQADIQGKGISKTGAGEHVRPIEEAIHRELTAEGTAISRNDLAIDGNKLIEIGIPRGKSLGIVLEELLETCLNDPSLNTAEKLESIAKNIYVQRFKNLLET